MDSFSPKLAHPITLVLKFGKIHRMIIKAISGHWVAYCMKWLHSSLHLKHRIWMHFSKQFALLPINQSQTTTPKTLLAWFTCCSKQILRIDPVAKRFCNNNLWYRITRVVIWIRGTKQNQVMVIVRKMRIQSIC